MSKTKGANAAKQVCEELSSVRGDLLRGQSGEAEFMNMAQIC